MKRFQVLIFATVFFSCSKGTLPADDFSIIGRWHLVGFEQTVMYQFTASKRHTLYSTDGTFGGLETAIPNPNDWQFEGDMIVVDLNFGNFLRVTPNFRCNGEVVDLINEDGVVNTTLFREGYNRSACN